MAVAAGHLGILCCLIKAGADYHINTHTEDEGDTPLILAIKRNAIALGRVLIQAGRADPNCPDADDVTPLFIASEKGFAPFVTLLLLHKAHVDTALSNGMTPLMIATYLGHEEVVNILLDANANAHQTNTEGENARDIARKNKYPQIEEMLNMAMKRTQPTCVFFKPKNMFSVTTGKEIVTHGIMSKGRL